jgi:hypothetical protein
VCLALARGALVAATIVSRQPGHQVLRVTHLDIGEELLRGGIAQRHRAATVVPDLHTVTDDGELKSARYTCHASSMTCRGDNWNGEPGEGDPLLMPLIP